MPINSVQTPNTLYGSNQATPAAQPEKAAQNLNADKKEKDLTVSISPEAQALQKAAASKKAEESERSDNEQAPPEEAPQQLQAERPAGKMPSRIDLSV